MTKRFSTIACALAALILIAGCAAQTQSSITPTPPLAAPSTAPSLLIQEAAAPTPYLVHLPGIAGPVWCDKAFVTGLSEGGIHADMHIYDWTCDDRGIHALWAVERNHEQAKYVASKIAEKYHKDPRTPIYLTCHSGGVGVAIWALECLPPDVKVQGLLMLAPAISPTYDLTNALTHIVGKAVCFCSPNDGLVLGYGTKVFGTIDGIRCDAAGKVGFTPPPTADAQQYAKLTTQPYNADWLEKYGYGGDHMGLLGRAFARGYIAPLLTGATAVIMP